VRLLRRPSAFVVCLLLVPTALLRLLRWPSAFHWRLRRTSSFVLRLPLPMLALLRLLRWTSAFILGFPLVPTLALPRWRTLVFWVPLVPTLALSWPSGRAAPAPHLAPRMPSCPQPTCRDSAAGGRFCT